MENCESCKAPCKCKGTISAVFTAATAIGAYYTVGTWRIVLTVLAVLFLVATILSFAGKFSCNCCCGDSCAPKATAKPVAKKAAKKKKQ
jgi:hypothetical protein